jgi:hypothetical protein
MFRWSLRQRANPDRSRPARHAIRYARPCLEELEPRTVMSTMYPGSLAYSPIIGPTVEAYSPFDNVIRTYGDGFQTSTGAYAPQTFAVNNTGLFAVDNGLGITVAASNPVAVVALGNSGFAAANTQLPGGTSSIVLLATTFANNGGSLLEVPSGENSTFGMSSGLGSSPTSLVSPFTPFVSLVDLPIDTANALIGLALQSAPAPAAPGLSTDPATRQIGRISPGFEGSINLLQLPPRVTQGLLRGGGGGGGGAPRNADQQQPLDQNPQEQEDLKREMESHMRLISWDDSPPAEAVPQAEDAFAYTAQPTDPLLLPPLLAELSMRDPLLRLS